MGRESAVLKDQRLSPGLAPAQAMGRRLGASAPCESCRSPALQLSWPVAEMPLASLATAAVNDRVTKGTGLSRSRDGACGGDSGSPSCRSCGLTGHSSQTKVKRKGGVPRGPTTWSQLLWLYITPQLTHGDSKPAGWERWPCGLCSAVSFPSTRSTSQGTLLLSFSPGNTHVVGEGTQPRQYPSCGTARTHSWP